MTKDCHLHDRCDEFLHYVVVNLRTYPDGRISTVWSLLGLISHRSDRWIKFGTYFTGRCSLQLDTPQLPGTWLRMSASP